MASPTTKTLSEQIREELAIFSSETPPSPEEVVRVHRALLNQLHDFARDFEQAARLNKGRIVPLWAGAGAAARLYHWLAIGRRRPSAGMGDNQVISFVRSRGGAS